MLYLVFVSMGLFRGRCGSHQKSRGTKKNTHLSSSKPAKPNHVLTRILTTPQIWGIEDDALVPCGRVVHNTGVREVVCVGVIE